MRHTHTHIHPVSSHATNETGEPRNHTLSIHVACAVSLNHAIAAYLSTLGSPTNYTHSNLPIQVTLFKNHGKLQPSIALIGQIHPSSIQRSNILFGHLLTRNTINAGRLSAFVPFLHRSADCGMWSRPGLAVVREGYAVLNWSESW